MSGRIDFTMGFNTRNTAHQSVSDNGFRIYILGNFSGRPDGSWEQRKIRGIDSDNFDRVISQIKPTIEIDSGLTLQFETLDDFHPDALLEKIQSMADLQKLKREINNPNTAAQAAAKIQAFCQKEATTEKPIQPLLTETREDTLQRLLGNKPEKTSAVTSRDAVDLLIDRLLAPHISKEADPQYQVLINLIDSMLSRLLQALLHRQDFQRLEALWRATDALVNEESGDAHRFFLVDISSAELMAEVRSGSHAFEQKLMNHAQSDEDQQDILIIGDHCFSDSEDDRDLLIFCSRLASACDGFFLSGVDPALIADVIFGTPENFQKWTLYLNEISADKTMLAYPRYLLRLPYGSKRDPIEAFEFEECPVTPQINGLLWGNSAFLCARVLIRIRLGQEREDHYYFNDIPAFTFTQDGEQMLQPGTETLLNETQANTLLSRGIIPLIGFRQRPGIRLIAVLTLSEYS